MMWTVWPLAQTYNWLLRAGKYNILSRPSSCLTDNALRPLLIYFNFKVTKLLKFVPGKQVLDLVQPLHLRNTSTPSLAWNGLHMERSSVIIWFANQVSPSSSYFVFYKLPTSNRLSWWVSNSLGRYSKLLAATNNTKGLTLVHVFSRMERSWLVLSNLETLASELAVFLAVQTTY